MTQSDLKAAIAAKKCGVYIFCGEENYLRRYYLGAFRKAILEDDALSAFNHIRFDAETADFGTLREALATPPVMADKKLVEWHLCHLDRWKDKELEEMRGLVETIKEYPYTVLVFSVEPEDFDYGNYPKKPSKLYTELNKICNICIFERSGDTALAAWIERHFAHSGINVTPAFCRETVAYCGHDMEVLSGEIEKIVCYIKANGGTEATSAVLHLVATPAVESDAFALSNALLDGDGKAAFRALSDMKRRRVEPTFLLGSVARIYADLLLVAQLSAEGYDKTAVAGKMKIHEYKAGLYMRAAAKKKTEALRATLAACRRIDAQAKSGGATGYGPIERLIAEETAVGEAL